MEGSREGAQQEDAHAGRISSYSELLLNCLGMGGGLSSLLPSPWPAYYGPGGAWESGEGSGPQPAGMA